MKFKLTKDEKNWILYDVGNSAFTLLITTIMPIYFNSLAGSAGVSETDYLAYWGYAASLVTLIVALVGPMFGAIADNKGFKKPIFTIVLGVGAVGCIALGFAKHWLVFLVILIIAKIGYSGSLIFYDSMLPDVTTEERADRVSSAGYAWGYIGSCIPFVLSLVLVLGGSSFGISMDTAMFLAFVITAVWWVGMTIPLLLHYKQKYYVEGTEHALKDTFGRLFSTLLKAREHSGIFWFLIAFFFSRL